MQKSPMLSPRLLKIAELLKKCRCVADIGTDHAYLPVFLCDKNKCERAMALDINEGPLKRAEETVKRYGFKERIELRLGGGAEPLKSGEADAITIAGMGGLMIGKIIEDSPEIFETTEQILLQPMSSVPEFRRKIWELGYRAEKEVLVKEENKLYHIFSVVKGEEEPLSPIELYMGRRLLEDMPEHFEEYLKKQKDALSRKIEGMEKGANKDETLIKEAKEMLSLLDEKERSL